jgi:alginate O-acetyltransferase complex protein AlgI
MNFNTTYFLLVFLPIVLVIFHLSPRQFRFAVLLIASCVFYAVSGLVPLAFMLLSIGWGFGAALVARNTRSGAVIAAAISFPLIVLYLFKYLNFTLDTVGASPELRDFFLFFLAVTLPAGISFYTFQIVGYIIDVRDHVVPAERNPLKLAVFISFFPQLIAGPILRYDQISSQLDRITRIQWLEIDARSGLKYLAIGLFGKVVISDLTNILIGNSWAVNFSEVATRADVLFLLNAYSIRIYFDFWAYSLMAIGLAKLFALNLPVNFREPYQSVSPAEFWRRWHVTLSFWIKDFIYLRLGGRDAYVRNIAIIFLAVGLWHGAGWTFVLWGAYHAVLVIGYHFSRPLWDKAPKAVRILVTYALVSLGWPLFFLDLGGYWVFLTSLVDPADGAGIYSLKHWVMIAPILAWIFFSKERVWLYNEKPHWLFDNPLLHAVLMVGALLFTTYSTTFIYFRF